MKEAGNFIADPVRIGDVPLVPAALIAQCDNGQQHVFNGCRIILRGKAAVPISGYTAGQDADHGRSGFGHRRINYRPDAFKQRRIIYGDQAGGLLIAA